MTEEATRTTMAGFIAELGITMEVEGGVDPRHLRSLKTVKDEDGWEHYAWIVILKRGSETLHSDYRTGIGHSTRKWNGWSDWIVTPTPPKIEDVLDSLTTDASCYEEALNFEDFASNLGYDTDSRKAERIYHLCGDMAKRLRFFLGREQFERLLWDVERL